MFIACNVVLTWISWCIVRLLSKYPPRDGGAMLLQDLGKSEPPSRGFWRLFLDQINLHQLTAHGPWVERISRIKRMLRGQKDGKRTELCSGKSHFHPALRVHFSMSVLAGMGLIVVLVLGCFTQEKCKGSSESGITSIPCREGCSAAFCCREC